MVLFLIAMMEILFLWNFTLTSSFQIIVVKNIKLMNESCKCVYLCVFFSTNFEFKCCCIRFASTIITLFIYPLLIFSIKEYGKIPSSRKELSHNSFKVTNYFKVQFACKGGHSNLGVISGIGYGL